LGNQFGFEGSLRASPLSANNDVHDCRTQPDGKIGFPDVQLKIGQAIREDSFAPQDQHSPLARSVRFVDRRIDQQEGSHRHIGTYHYGYGGCINL